MHLPIWAYREAVLLLPLPEQSGNPVRERLPARVIMQLRLIRQPVEGAAGHGEGGDLPRTDVIRQRNQFRNGLLVLKQNDLLTIMRFPDKLREMTGGLFQRHLMHLFLLATFYHKPTQRRIRSRNERLHINVFYSDQDRGYIADIPDLKYCSAFGETPKEAVREVMLAKAAWLKAARVEGKTVPAPRHRPAIYQPAS